MGELRDVLAANYGIVTEIGAEDVNFKGPVNAESGLDTVQGTLTLGDPLDIESSGGQQTNYSRVTGIRYQVPYQAVDKTGASVTFQVDLDAEIVDDVRQGTDDTTMTSPLVWSYTSGRDEVVNKVYLKTDGGVTNFRYQVKSLDTGQVIDSYPDKFKYAEDVGIDLIGAGIHTVDLYYSGTSTPNRFLDTQNIEITMNWDSGNFLGNSSDVPYYSYDYQAFYFVNILTEAPNNGKQYGRQSESWTEVVHSGHYLGVFADLAALQAAHPTATMGDTATVTSPDSNLFYWNGSAWTDSGTGYIGDMLKAIYDPTNISGDAFLRSNHTGTQAASTISDFDTEVANNSDVTANTSKETNATHTGDVTGSEDLTISAKAVEITMLADGTDGELVTWDVSGEADTIAAGTADQVLTSNGPGAAPTFQDTSAAPGRKMTVTTGDHIENLDVSSLSPSGVLFVNTTANKELKSLSGGIDGDVVHLVHTSNNDLKIKNPDSYTGQEIQTPGDADRTLIDYGGCTLVYNDTLGYWVATGLYY